MIYNIALWASVESHYKGFIVLRYRVYTLGRSDARSRWKIVTLYLLYAVRRARPVNAGGGRSKTRFSFRPEVRRAIHREIDLRDLYVCESLETEIGAQTKSLGHADDSLTENRNTRCATRRSGSETRDADASEEELKPTNAATEKRNSKTPRLNFATVTYRLVTHAIWRIIIIISPQTAL